MVTTRVTQGTMSWRHLPAHLLTAVRVPLAGLLWVHPESPRYFLLILIIGGVSDVFDGVLARLLDGDASGDPRHIGAWLDPVCDKIFAASCLTAAYFSYHPNPIYVAMLVLREVMQLPLLLIYLISWAPRGRTVDLAALPAGKLTTVLQFFALLAIVVRSPALAYIAPLVAITGCVTVVAFLRRARGHADDAI